MRTPLVIAVAAAVALTGIVFGATATNEQAAAAGIFSENVRPSVAVDSDRAGVELGVRFTPQKPGTISAIQYYQSTGARDVKQATLWSSNGKVLAKARFKATRTAGWRTVKLDTPVKVKARSTYVASYFAPKGGYPSISNDLASDKTLNGFTLKKGAGVFHYGSKSRFPKSTFRGNNYLVDVVFTPSGSVTTPPTIKPTAPPVVKPTTPPVVKPTTPPVTTPKPPVTAPKPPVTAPKPPVTAPTTPAAGRFPTASTTGIPSGWTPKTKVTGDYWVRTDGAVVEDLQITSGAIRVAAKNVTLRRISGTDASVSNYTNGVCYNGLKIEDSSFVTKGRTTDSGDPVIGPGGYTVNNVLIDGAPEGLRVGGKGLGCGDVNVTSSFVRIAAPQVCNDWHGDGIQGYDGGRLVVRNSAIVMNESNGCHGTAPFFYPGGQGNTSIDVDGLIVSGAGYPFRSGMPGKVKNLNVVENTWGYGPISVKCSAISSWQASIVRLDAAGQPQATKSLACSTETNG
ncbi:DUF4082 domain-containing protein [Microbacterium sp. MAHUQ-60]|uniref:DUF4082 domain-containing protein n=1 Tax=unclassified Microbacterium TaxID=2609290 RepID=UPI0036174ADA